MTTTTVLNCLKDKVVLVVGGDTSLPLSLSNAVCDRLEKAGAKVVQFGVSSGCKSATLFIKGKPTVEDDVNACLAEIVRKFGVLDVVVNTRMVFPGLTCTLQMKDLTAVRDTFEENVTSHFMVCRAALAVITKNNPNWCGERGVVINTVSVASVDTSPCQAGFAASQAALLGMSTSLAGEFACRGIRFNTVCLGPMEGQEKPLLPKEMYGGGKVCNFPTRVGRAREYAHAVHMLAENSMFNGTMLRLDGMSNHNVLPGETNFAKCDESLK